MAQNFFCDLIISSHVKPSSRTPINQQAILTTMSLRTRINDITPYITRDGSEIKELMHPAVQGNKTQSLAEAIVQQGQQTQLHRHYNSEELYFITQGKGHMKLGEEQFEVTAGDTICIPPGTAHCIKNIGTEALHILCMCSPPYNHADTELLEQD